MTARQQGRRPKGWHGFPPDSYDAVLAKPGDGKHADDIGGALQMPLRLVSSDRAAPAQSNSLTKPPRYWGDDVGSWLVQLQEWATASGLHELARAAWEIRDDILQAEFENRDWRTD